MRDENPCNPSSDAEIATRSVNRPPRIGSGHSTGLLFNRRSRRDRTDRTCSAITTAAVESTRLAANDATCNSARSRAANPDRGSRCRPRRPVSPRRRVHSCIGMLAGAGALSRLALDDAMAYSASHPKFLHSTLRHSIARVRQIDHLFMPVQTKALERIDFISIKPSLHRWLQIPPVHSIVIPIEWIILAAGAMSVFILAPANSGNIRRTARNTALRGESAFHFKSTSKDRVGQRRRTARFADACNRVCVEEG